MSTPVIRELLAAETRLAYFAMRELRPHVGSESEFVERVNEIQRAEGYRLIGSFAEGDEHVAGVAGFRTGHFLAWGYTLYCDDLSSRPEFRRQGHAKALIDWMVAEALRLGCEQFHLDSGVGPERQDAHRLYFNERMRVSAHHFARDLQDDSQA